MNDMISSHSSFDEPRYWRFERNSGLPYGYFDRWRITADHVVVAVSLVCLVIALAVSFRAEANTLPPPGECVRLADGSLLCAQCPVPEKGAVTPCTERGRAEDIPVNNPLALLLAAGAVALVAARTLRRK